MSTGAVDSPPKNEKTKASLSSPDLKDSWLLRQLLSSYRSCPSFIKIGGLDFSFTIASFLFISAFRVLFLQLLIYLGWPLRTKMTTDAASSLASIIHAALLCSWLSIFFAKLGWQNYIPSCKLSTHKDKDFQDVSTACLQVCTGYMMFDSFWLVKDTYDLGLQPLTEFDCMVIAHHFMTSFYMTSCRVIQAGHISAMILMLTGELSNPLMNAMFTTRFAIQLECCNSDNMMLLHSLLEHIFAIVYFVLRISIGPACAIHLSYDLLFTKQGRCNVPLHLSMIWVALVAGVLLGSGPFVMDAVDMLKDGWDLKYPPTFDFGERFEIQGEEL
uniref:TLC domain-containing protein n=1 Tax=Ditylum brightwellii TaxID=49249 RepID=A0A6U3QUS2_9STRA|mmetsp:Transcript_22482/g.33465  ORF Transcript_22482/g.33465 Transcript_22482/m.33465 type:complete len:329 (+) Transcript_22482:210-1196(+)